MSNVTFLTNTELIMSSSQENLPLIASDDDDSGNSTLYDTFPVSNVMSVSSEPNMHSIVIGLTHNDKQPKRVPFNTLHLFMTIIYRFYSREGTGAKFITISTADGEIVLYAINTPTTLSLPVPKSDMLTLTWAPEFADSYEYVNIAIYFYTPPDTTIIQNPAVPFTVRNVSPITVKSSSEPLWVSEYAPVAADEADAYSIQPNESVAQYCSRMRNMATILGARQAETLSSTLDDLRAFPEMDNGSAESAGLLQQESSNVTIALNTATAQDKASNDVTPEWCYLSTTEQMQSFEGLTDRDLISWHFDWTTSQAEGYPIKDLVLPRDFLNLAGKKYCNTPNFIPFNVYAFWRGDMEITISINSNAFQSGMLLASFLYASDSYDQDTIVRTRQSSVACLVQQPHCTVLAGTNNSGKIDIPYRYVRPFVRNKQYYATTTIRGTSLNIGRLRICPLVQLSTGTAANSPQTCGVSVYVKMRNSRFTGMIDGTIANPEMNRLGNIINNTLGVVDKVIGDLNCDDPPGTRPAAFFVPQNAQSWSHGTNSYEPTYTLRLDGGRIGVGRSKDIGYSETEISEIASVYGLLRPITWTSVDQRRNVPGYLLWQMSVHPQCDKNHLYQSGARGGMTSYVVPPCGVISSMFCYWRGSLNFKFDIVANTKHTGSILVAYVPGYAGTGRLSMEQAKGSTYTTFSLNEETRSFTFSVPYIAETMWWQRKYGGAQRAADFQAPSTIFMYVLNPLVPMESVAQEIKILPYICAGPDFEVCIPAQPALGLATNNQNIIPDSQTVQFKSGYYPVYVGEWRNWYGGNKTILRYGSTTDHIAQITTPLIPPQGKAYYYTVRSPRLMKSFKTSIKGGSFKDQDIDVAALKQGDYQLGYGVAYVLDGYYYMIPFPVTNNTDNSGEKAAQVLAIALAQKKDLSTVADAVPNWIADSDYLTQENIIFDPKEVDIPVVANPEMASERKVTPNVLDPTGLLPSTRSGLRTFGESFVDLKDLCRRYQLYWEGTVTPGLVRANKRNAAFVQLPVLPQGLKLEPSIENPVWNNMRDGHIPLIASGYRFYRGGVRFRIVVTGLQDSIWVQHHPDRYLEGAKPILGKNIHDKDAYRNHSYAFHVQNLSVNRTIVIEVPYYKPGLYGLSGASGSDFDSREYGSLGDLVIGLEGDQPVNDPIDIAVYYTIADDLSFNVFCGFPTMVFCDEVFKPNVNTFEAIENYADRTKKKKETDIVLSTDDDGFEHIVAAPEMDRAGAFLTSAASSVFGSLVGSVAVRGLDAVSAPIVHVVKTQVKKEISPALQEIEHTVSEAAKEISDTLGKTLPQQAIIQALGQFSQVALNPTPASIAIAISSLVVNFVTISMELMLTMQELLTSFLHNVWEKYFASAPDLQEAMRRPNPEGFVDEMPEKTLHGFLGMLFTAVAGTTGYTCAKPSSFPNVMKGVKECLNVCNSSVVFFRNIVDCIIYMYRYVLGETSEELKAKIIIEREYPHMKQWCEEVMTLLDPRNSNKIMHSTRQANRVFDACMYGAKIIQSNLDINMPGGKVIYDLYTKLCKMRDDIVELGNHPDVRFEAFPLWMCGDAGIGKSYMTQEVCKELLQAINYRTSECMIYWLSLGQKYWNGIKNPPVIARDEAYAVGGQFTEEEIATHLAICSSSILNPPMAALQEKNKRLNPLIYYMNSNLEFPQISEARHPEAIYRRRKILARASYTDRILQEYPGIVDASELPPHERENFNHLKFNIAVDPKNRNTPWSRDFTYTEFIRFAKDKFAAHVEQERVNFRQRMNAAYSLDPDYDTGDQLQYVHGTTLSTMTLHEQYMAERDMARRILYTAPPTVEEDEYISGILSKFSYLWSTPDAIVPEMDRPSTSNGTFYSASATAMGDKIGVQTALDRGAIMKLVSGGMVYTDEDIANFVVPEFMEQLIHRGMKLQFSNFIQQVSMLPTFAALDRGRVGWDDSLHKSGGKVFRDKYLEHWSRYTGVESLRAYVYWIMRTHQYQEFVRELLKTSTKDKIIADSCMSFLRNVDSTLLRKIREAETEEQWVEVFRLLDHASPNDVRQLQPLVCLIRLLTICTEEEAFCEHCQFWVTHLHDTSSLEYSPRYGTMTYVNELGLRVTWSNWCSCPNSVVANPLFQNAMRIIWNHDHGTISHNETNPFSFAEHRIQEERITSWLTKIWEWAKEWWRHVAMPFVSTILTFLYEHFGKILAVLMGMYGLYSLYHKYKVAEKVADVLPSKETVQGACYAMGRMASGAVIATHMRGKDPPAKGHPDICKNKEDLCPIGGEKRATPQDTLELMKEERLSLDELTDFIDAHGEAAGYCKIDKPRAARASSVPASREGIVDQINTLERRIRNNICWIVMRYCVKDERGQDQYREIRGRCLAIRERQILVIRHYLEEMLSRQGQATFMLTYMVSGRDATAFLTRQHLNNVKWYQVSGSMESNYGLLTLPKYCPMFRNILSSIVRRPDHAYVTKFASLLSQDPEGRMEHKYQMPVSAREHVIIAGDKHVKEIPMDVSYEYGVHGVGMCGSLLVCEGVCRGNPGIIGLHVAGVRGKGFAEPIYREMFEHESVKPQIDYVLPNFGDPDNANIELDTNLLLYGIVDNKYAHHESGKTKIVPSLLHNQVYPVRTEPNPLAPNDPRQPYGSHPLRDGCNKHGIGYSIPFDEGLMNVVSHDQRLVLLNNCKNPLMTMRELTLEEAVCGSTLIPHCEALNWKSSEGFPLSTFRPKETSGKKYLFDLEEDQDGYKLKGISPLLEKIMLMRERTRMEDKVIPPVYIDCLKDYRLTPEKCAIPGKTRVFSIAPIQVTLDVRRYMGLFLSAYRSGTVFGQHGIGINPDSIEWTQLANYLHEVGDNIVTGDYSNFGPTLSSQVVMQVIDDIMYWHNMNGVSYNHDKHLRIILEGEIANPFHLCSNLVYQTINGIASGSPITAELNSEVNKYYIKLAFLLLCLKFQFVYTMEDFNNKVRLVTYGDDFIMSVHDDFISWFNCASIADVLRDYGIVLTDVAKGKEIVPYRPLSESSFLKRGFRQHPTRRGVYLAPIEIQSITECINWCHKQSDIQAATQEVVRASCVLAYGHGPNYYKRHTEKIHETALRVGLDVNYPPWHEIDKVNFG